MPFPRFLWLCCSVVLGLAAFTLSLGTFAPAQAAVPVDDSHASAPAANFWQPLNGPLGGWVTALAINQNTGMAFASFPAYMPGGAGIAGSRAFRSANNGVSWTPIFSSGFESRYLVSFAPSGTTTLFAGTQTTGIFRSNNNGDTWVALTGYTATANLTAVGLNPVSAQLFANTRGQGVWRSTNGGVSWAQVNAGLPVLTMTAALAFDPTGNIYVGTVGAGVFSSTTGTSWSAVGTGISGNVLALARTPTGTLFAATDTFGVYRLDVGAATWNAVNTGLPDLRTDAILFHTASQQLFLTTLAGLYRSADLGATWLPSTAGLSVGPGQARPRKLAANASNGLFVGTTGGPYFSGNYGNTWSPVFTGLDVAIVRRLVVQPNGVIVAGTRTNGVYTSADGGQTWGLSGPDSLDVFSLERHPNGDVYVGIYLSGPANYDTHLYHTADDGATWVTSTPGVSVTMAVVGGIGFRGPNEIYAGTAWGTGIVSSTDGVNWTPAGMTNPTVGLSVLPDGTIYASTEGFGTYRRALTDTTWVNVGMTNVQAYRFLTDSLGYVYAATSGMGNGPKGVFRSTNNGYSWTNIFSASLMNDLAVTPNDTLFAAGDQGVWTSGDHGANWTLLGNSGMPTIPVLGLYFAPNGYLYAGTSGGGVYRSAAPLTGTVDISPTILNAAAVGRGALHQPFTYTFEATGTLPLTLSTSALPAGLGLYPLDATHAIITGTPLVAGNTNVTLQAQNGAGAAVRGVAISITTVPLTPLVDLVPGFYLGQFAGGLYSGTNTMPAAHANAGAHKALLIQPRDISGNITNTGKYVLLSIGMSNASQEFCHQSPNTTACNAWSFAGQAATDGAVNHTSLVILNGARGGQDVTQWLYPTMTEYSRIQNLVLASNGYSETQVQAVWLKQSNVLSPTSPRLPSPNADAYGLLQRLGLTVRALKTRYPHLQLVFLSPRTYGGFGYSESQSYEVGFAMQWLIQAQIRQMATGQVDPLAGDLDYTTVAPWLGWSAYLWADGWHPNSQGVWWEPQDFESDWTHPSTAGETKVGGLLLNFFKTSPHTACWFLVGQTCGVKNYAPLIGR